MDNWIRVLTDIYLLFLYLHIKCQFFILNEFSDLVMHWLIYWLINVIVAFKTFMQFYRLIKLGFFLCLLVTSLPLLLDLGYPVFIGLRIFQIKSAVEKFNQLWEIWVRNSLLLSQKLNQRCCYYYTGSSCRSHWL